VEKISQLMDGELDPATTRRELDRLKPVGELRERWDRYHLIGDALRGEPVLSPDFGRRLSQRLAGEATVLAPRRSTLRRITTYALSAAASLSAVALVGWVAIGTQTASVLPNEVAKAPAPVRVEPVPKAQLANLPYDGSHNEYLMAHTGFSPSTAIQGVAPYIRSVATAQPAPTR
jgi:sigma-E factor negative regulatory protein RseA